MQAELLELTKQSRHDPKVACPSCWENAMQNVARAGYDRAEAEGLIRAAIRKASKSTSDVLPTWDQLERHLLADLDLYYAHGCRDNAAPGFRSLLQKLGHAANASYAK